jgi:hypothetical protein
LQKPYLRVLIAAKKYQALGIQEVVLRCQWPGMPNEDSLRAVELFGREVLPRFG